MSLMHIGRHGIRAGDMAPDAATESDVAVRNESGGTLTAGTPVYVSDWNETEQRPLVSKADANAAAKQAQYVLPNDIANNTNGVARRKFRSAATLNTNAYAAKGDAAYLSETAGAVTETAPTASSSFVQEVARVAVKSATIGVLEYDVKAPSKIGSNELQPGAAGASGETVSWTGDISPAAIAAQADNYNPTSLSTAAVLRLSLTGAQTITGIAGGADGRLLIVHNIDATDALTLSDEDAASTAANRLALQGNVVLAPDTSVLLQYDSTSSRWRMVGGVLGAGALTADAAGRALMAASFFNTEATFDAKADADVVGEDRLAPNQITGRVIANGAAANVIGAIPVRHIYSIGDAAGNTDITITHKTEITDVTVIKTAGAGGAGDTVQLFNGASAISNAMSLNAADQTVVRAGTIDDAQNVVAAAGTLRVTIVDGNAGATDLSCRVIVTGHRSA